MKVLLVAYKCDRSRGSEFLSGWGWATAYAAAGDEVWVLSGPDGEPGHGEVVSSGGGRCVFERMAPPAWSSRGGFSLRYALWQRAALTRARRLARSIAFDLVHHVSLGSLQAGSQLSRLGVPFIFGPVGGGQSARPALSRFFGSHWWRERLRTMLMCRLIIWSVNARQSVRRAHLVLAANCDTKRLAITLGARRVHLESDAVIPLSFFPQTQPPTKGRQEALHLLWVGRVFPRKGLLLTLEGLAAVPPSIPWHLSILGGGTLSHLIPGWLNELALTDRVTVHGQVPLDDVRRAYHDADVFIFTSLRDSGPSQLVEAMAFGLPVITLDMHGQHLLIGPDRGIRVEASTAEMAIAGLARAVTLLHSDRDQLRRLSTGAAAYARREALPCKFARVRTLMSRGAVHASNKKGEDWPNGTDVR